MELTSVVVIDDEEIIRTGICNSIPWESLGMVVKGEASNGEEGLRLIQEVMPDLAILDVRMPIMDGLQLAEYVGNHFPDMKIIILSGYDDFRYAQRAMNAGVSDYILKPIYRPHFIKIIQKINKKINGEKAERDKTSMLIQKVKLAEPLILNDTILDLVNGQIPDSDTFDKRLAALQLNLGFSFAAIALVEPQKNPDINCSKFNVNNQIKKLVNDCIGDYGISFIADKNMVGVIISWDKLNSLETVRKNAMEKIEIKLTIGVGNPVDKLFKINRSYLQAQKALEDKLYRGRDQCLYYSHILPIKKSIQYPSRFESRLSEVVRCGSSKTIGHELDGLFDYIVQNGPVEKNELYKLILRLVIAVERSVLPHFYLNNSAEHGIISYDDFMVLDTLCDIHHYVLSYLIDINKYLNSEERESMGAITKRAVWYIHNDYKGATLTSVSEKVCVTPNYLSLLFKQETGKNFVEYLTDIRVEKARELLLSTELKNYQIAEEVGYPNSRYFSQIFKKAVGKTPSEFRNSI